jgi:hypothetical protein
LNLCYDVSGVSASSVTFPGLVVHMTNVDFEIPVSSVCLAMALSDQFSIIGNIQQQNNIIVYDVVNKRIGFQAFDCATLA